MAHAELTETVRRLVERVFASLGVRRPEQVRESILIRNGAYCGRRFQTPEASAVWFVEENEVKFYRADGELVRVIEPEVSTRLRAAA